MQMYGNISFIDYQIKTLKLDLAGYVLVNDIQFARFSSTRILYYMVAWTNKEVSTTKGKIYSYIISTPLHLLLVTLFSKTLLLIIHIHIAQNISSRNLWWNWPVTVKVLDPTIFILADCYAK